MWCLLNESKEALSYCIISGINNSLKNKDVYEQFYTAVTLLFLLLSPCIFSTYDHYSISIFLWIWKVKKVGSVNTQHISEILSQSSFPSWLFWTKPGEFMGYK